MHVHDVFVFKMKLTCHVISGKYMYLHLSVMCAATPVTVCVLSCTILLLL